MREQIFVSEVIASLRDHGAWAYKIPDMPTSWVSRRTRFTPAKPCDIVAAFHGKFIAIECKQMKQWKSFPISSLRESQVQALDDLHYQGARASVFLNVRIAKEENRLIIFEWGWLKTQKSIHAKMLKELPYIDGKRGRFNLGGFLGAVRTDA